MTTCLKHFLKSCHSPICSNSIACPHFEAFSVVMVKRPTPMKVVCAYCEIVITEGKGDKVSHGVCSFCFERIMKGLEKLEEVIR